MRRCAVHDCGGGDFETAGITVHGHATVARVSLTDNVCAGNRYGVRLGNLGSGLPREVRCQWNDLRGNSVAPLYNVAALIGEPTSIVAVNNYGVDL
ncbi:MAG: hypothetical protein U0531_13415 [Dehalococcoidia bacterium]